jgi:glycosyltransferase involved in cell wall biosynthesis
VHAHQIPVVHTVALALTIPWIAVPVMTLWRARRFRSLDEVSDIAPSEVPLVSVVIPARNEERNIARCVRSALASTYPNFEVVVVNDHSTDGTGAILNQLAAQDARLVVVTPEPLPSDWFGKQWACAAGVAAARGDILAFFDADTWQTPDLLTRAINAMIERRADMLSVLGAQELGTFWERLVQPQMFSGMLTRYGGSETVNDARRVTDKIANGQCIIVRRDAYESAGGHAAVRNRAAEDLALAQLWFTLGKRCVLIVGLDQLTTRMYTSLAELRAGWGKNIFAAGRETAPFGPVGRFLFPVLLQTPAIGGFLPAVILALALSGMLGTGALLWSAICTAVNVLWWFLVYRWLRMSLAQSIGYALMHPLGALAMLEISIGAVARGRRVRWKDREYVAE